MKEKDIIVDRQGMYRLFEDESGDKYIGVMCGGMAVYELKIKLNNEELSEYQSKGKDALDDMAREIAHNSKSYEDRAI